MSFKINNTVITVSKMHDVAEVPIYNANSLNSTSIGNLSGVGDSDMLIWNSITEQWENTNVNKDKKKLAIEPQYHYNKCKEHNLEVINESKNRKAKEI